MPGRHDFKDLVTAAASKLQEAKDLRAGKGGRVRPEQLRYLDAQIDAITQFLDKVDKGEHCPQPYMYIEFE